MDVASFDDLGESAVFDHAGAARHREVADERAVEFETDQAVVRTRGEALAEQDEGGATVEVVGVGDAEGLGEVQVALGREHRARRCRAGGSGPRS